MSRGRQKLCYATASLRTSFDQLDGEETTYKRRFGYDFAGPLIPFGAHVEYLPITEEDKARCHQFGSKMLAGIFLGYEQQSVGGWRGGLLVADCGQIEKRRAC